LLKYKKVRFLGHRDNLKKEIKAIDGFPYAIYLDDDGIPVLFANDEEGKNKLFEECKELGIEIVI
jgi:hypothetical protein